MKVCSVLLSALLLGVLLVASVCAQPPAAGIETQVLRIFATKQAGYYHKPWKTPDFSRVKGSGFFFKDEQTFPGRRGLILTNAHAVSMAQGIKVSNGTEKKRYNVKLLGICNSADFAVLEMDSDEFEAMEKRNGKVVPLDLGDSDSLRVGDKVQGWGYPLGGERISKSEQGEISRIEVNRYAYSGERWLMMQASLQQNSGNSGGPVLKDGKVVGVSFQGISASDRINYFIPINVIKGLMPLLGKQELIPHWRYVVQHLFPALKEYYGLGAEQGGVLVTYLIPGGAPERFGMRVNDILLEIEGHEIDNYGEIFFKPLGQKIYFSEVLNRKRVGDPLAVKVIREGKTREIKGTVGPGLARLVPRIFTTANYFIFNAVGFVELSQNCISNLGKSGEAFGAKYDSEYPKLPDEKIVIISEIFPEYGLVETSSYLRRVEEIDGEKILNISHLYERINDLMRQGKKTALLTLHSKLQLPLDLARAGALDKAIQEKYGILYMKTDGGFHK
jgi:S1-C subfamily serine protease